MTRVGERIAPPSAAQQLLINRSKPLATLSRMLLPLLGCGRCCVSTATPKRRVSYNYMSFRRRNAACADHPLLHVSLHLLLAASLEIVLVNEIVGGAETAGYLLKYDSIHGCW